MKRFYFMRRRAFYTTLHWLMTGTWAGAGTHRGRFSPMSRRFEEKLAHYRCQSCGWTTSFLVLKPIIPGIIWRCLKGLWKPLSSSPAAWESTSMIMSLMTGCILAGVLYINVFWPTCTNAAISGLLCPEIFASTGMNGINLSWSTARG